MITSTTVMWTCVPNGVVTTSTGAIASPLTLQLSVAVTPQLVGATGDTIAGTIFQNWPAYVRALTAAGNWQVTFQAKYGQQATLATNYVSATTGLPTDAMSATTAFNVDGSYLWQAIFPATTPVLTTQTTSSTANAVAQYKIHSFDAGTIAKAIRAAHRYAVQSHLQHGKLVLTGSDPYSVLIEERKKAKRVLPQMAAALQGVSRGAVHHVLRQAYQAETGDVGLGFELMRHALYYDHDRHRARLRASTRHGMRPDTDDGGAGSAALANDFNTLFAHLGGQPQLLRKLGLVIDLQLTPPPAVLSWLALYEKQANAPIVPTLAEAWTVQLVPPYLAAGSLPGANLSIVKHVGPITSTDLTPTLFRTTVLAPPSTTSGGSVNSGFIPLGDPTQYTAYTEDTEGTPIKLDIAAGATPSPSGTDLAQPLPALRTAGVAISQIGRDTVLDGSFQRQQAYTTQYWLNSNNPNADVPGNCTLFADDLIRGYAIDIQVTNPYASGGTTTSHFTSICKRNTRMYFPTLAAIPGVPAGTAGSFMIADEGYSKASAANAPGAGDELDLHSALWGWEGWSLAAQRPGRAIVAATPPGDIVQTETPTQPLNTPASNFPNCQFIVGPLAGSLPRLRFGYTYSFRARVLDLAGNDMSGPNTVAGVVPLPLTVTVAGETSTVANPTLSPSITYLRYEPVANPVLVLQAPLGEGEHLENLVIRSNPWGPLLQNASEYAEYVNASSTIAPMNNYVVPCARWAAPPKGSWSQAEQMGALDENYFDPLSQFVTADLKSGAITAGLPYSAATFLPITNALAIASQKEAGLFTDTAIWDSSNTTSLTATASNNATIVTPPGAQNLPPPTNPGQPLAPGQYNILVPNPATSGLAPAYIPYIPDANALAISFQTLNPNGTVATQATRTYVPRKSCIYPEMDMPQLQLADAPLQNGVRSAPPSLGTANPAGLDAVPATSGATPSPPSGSPPIVFALAPGQTFSFNYGSVVKDTTKMANSDVAPAGGAAQTIPTYAPFRTISMVHAVQQPMPPAPLATVASWQEGFNIAQRKPGDTSVTITGGFNVDTLTSQSCDFAASWVEYLDVEMSTNVTQAPGTNIRSTIKEGRLGSWNFDTPTAEPTPITFTATPAASSPTVTTLAPFVLQFGDTKTRLITFQATASSRFREFFPASLQANAANFQNATPLGTLTAGQLLSAGTRVPSTARPKAPDVLYVLPTFGWTSVTSTSTTRPVTTTTTNTRTGRGLRVFVGRPWFATGDGEQLAVLVNPLGSNSTALSGFVSQWGMDPIRNPQKSALPSGATPPTSTIVDGQALLDQTQIPSGNLVTAVPLAETTAAGASLGSVTILTFSPSAYDEVRQLWYFDVEFAANDVEAPFVRLALARYQPNSLGGPGFTNGGPDLRMSTVVLADMVKLAADRTASYAVSSSNTVSITIAGYVFADGPWTPAPSIPVAIANPAAAHGRLVFAQVMEATVANPGEFDWLPLGEPVSLTPYQTPQGPSPTYLSFEGNIPKPTTLAPNSHHQLLITELEYFTTDQEAAFPPLPVSGGPQNPVYNLPPQSMLPPNTSSRVVFSDVLPLPY